MLTKTSQKIDSYNNAGINRWIYLKLNPLLRLRIAGHALFPSLVAFPEGAVDRPFIYCGSATVSTQLRTTTDTWGKYVSPISGFISTLL